MTARYIVGDAREVMASLEPGSVDLVMTSPPFLALRSYLPSDHELKSKEIGSEATPGEFLDVMLDVVEACARVLAPHGSLVFELGDTYAGSGGAGGDYNDGGLRDGAPGFTGSARAGRLAVYGDERGNPDGMRDSTFQGGNTRNGGGRGWPLDKSKVLIPQLFAIALAYGFNPLTGRQTEPWRVRNTVAWCRPNPPVGRDGDKFRAATSFLTVACKARDRYWDGDAVRTAHTVQNAGPLRGRAAGMQGMRTGDCDATATWESGERMELNPAGAPLLDWWEISTEPYAGAHYATWPRKLVVPVIEAMAPRRVCRVCGEPSRRITGEPEYVQSRNTAPVLHMRNADGSRAANVAQNVNQHEPTGARSGDVVRVAPTLGWSDCGHGPENMRNGMVLDPFGGSGVTGLVATGHGRDCVLVDLDERNAELARERIGPMFLTVERFAFPIGEVS